MTGSIALKCKTCQEYVVFQDRASHGSDIFLKTAVAVSDFKSLCTDTPIYY